MNNSLKTLRDIEIRQSELKQEAAQLSVSKDLTDEQRERLDKLPGEIQDTERQYRAAKLTVEQEDQQSVQDDQTGEGSELKEIRSRARVGKYLANALQGAQNDGAEKELNESLKIPVSEFPLELLAPEQPVEKRSVTDVDSGSAQAPWIDRLFSSTAAGSLGITFRAASPGVYSVPVVTSGADSAQRAKEEDLAEATYAYSVQDLKPKRVGVHTSFSKEDAYRLSMLEKFSDSA